MLAVETGLVAALEADATLMAEVEGIFRDGSVPEGTAFPYVVFSKVSAPETYTFTRRAASKCLYQLKVEDEGHDQTRANTIRDRLDVVLMDQALDVSPLTWKGTRREATWDFTETDNGVTYQHVGSDYRIVVG